VKFFLDNCIAVQFAGVLRALDIDAVHLTEYIGPDGNALPPSTRDEDWMPLAAQTEHIAVTGDSRIIKKPQQRVLRESVKLTTVFMPKGYVNLQMWDQLIMLVRYWPAISTTCERAKRGDCIEVSQSGKASFFVPPR
jgi:hypothetical protein